MYYIYKIENLVNHKKYIGLTNNYIRRKGRHFSDLKRKCHDNSFLQKEFNIYGADNFSFEVIFQDNITEIEAGEKEKYYISLYDSYRNGYNQNEGGNFGASNGGSHLTQSDVFNILSVIEFMSRPGQVLANIFDVSRATISRIGKGISHTQNKEEYEALPIEDRRQIYQIFIEDLNLLEEKANSSKLQTKRKLTKEQVFLIFLNEELHRPKPIEYFLTKFKISSSNTIYCILKGETYQDYKIEYNKLSQSEKNKLATLLRN